MKKFFVTIDTEGDNLWSWKAGDKITTRNVLYLQRFQELCNDYGYKPTWLSNYEMISDPDYIDFVCKVVEQDQGELGMHLHAWNSPPEYSLNVSQSGAPYLIEYPEEIMEEKIAYLTEIIWKRCGIHPISHRAGRWAVDERYLRILAQFGYRIDCSVTPGINWKNCVGASNEATGSDYTDAKQNPYWIYEGELLEVPVTVRKIYGWFQPWRKTLRGMVGSLYRCIKGQYIWLRPTNNNLEQMLKLIDLIEGSERDDYIMFMIHSSELMPGGSPTFKTEESVEKLYKDLGIVFKKLQGKFEGITLKKYFDNFV